MDAARFMSAVCANHMMSEDQTQLQNARKVTDCRSNATHKKRCDPIDYNIFTANTETNLTEDERKGQWDEAKRLFLESSDRKIGADFLEEYRPTLLKKGWYVVCKEPSGWWYRKDCRRRHRAVVPNRLIGKTADHVSRERQTTRKAPNVVVRGDEAHYVCPKTNIDYHGA